MINKPVKGNDLMDNENIAEKEYNKLIEVIGNSYKGVQSPDSKKFLKQTGIINEISRFSDVFFLFLDHVKFKLIFFSDNFSDFFGYEKDLLKKYNMLLFFKMLSSKHISFPNKMHEWHQENEKNFDLNDRLKGIQYLFTGIEIKSKDGRKMKILIHLHPLEINKDSGNPMISLITVKDISSFYNGHHFWVRYACGEGLNKTSYFLSSEKLAKGCDLFSVREKEILKFINLGKTSKEIAQELFLSQSTVEKHRKNILKRTGFSDISGLFSVLKIDKIF